jgi:hypothetical protein
MLDTQGMLEFPIAVKGPKSAGIVKINKAYLS